MKLIVSAAFFAVLGIPLASAQEYGSNRQHNYAVPVLPRVPVAPRAPRAPGPDSYPNRGFTPYKPPEPYQGYKPPRHFNIYTNRWEG